MMEETFIGDLEKSGIEIKRPWTIDSLQKSTRAVEIRIEVRSKYTDDLRAMDIQLRS